MEYVENEIKEVGPGFWIRVAVDNISWYDLGDSAAVIDALEDPQQADVVRNHIKETTGKNLKWVVQTHWDVDHISCNPQWKKEGAIVIAHQSCLDSAGDWEGRPDIAYADRSTLQGVGNKRIESRWVGGTHTPWDTLLYFPEARVLHIADLFGWGLIPCQPTEKKLARLNEVLDIVQSYDADALICGHGPTLTKDHIVRFRSYLDDMLAQVPSLCKAGKSQEQIEKEIAPPSDMESWWRFTAWKHAKNIELISQFSC